jgi:16S rRNA processing protein RimM
VGSEPTVAVGVVTRAHGVHGEVAVLVISDVEGRFDDDATVWLEDGRALSIASSRKHGDRLLVRFREVHDRSQAEALSKAVLFVPESMSPELPPGSWWDHQLVGCRVATDAGRELGELKDVIHTAANDVWSVLDEEGTETLIPVLNDVLIDVDVGDKRIFVREIEGLTVPE